MALITDSISNFIGGVSQQPDKLMYPNQSKEMNNFLLNPARGAIKRPPTEHIKKLIDIQDKHIKTHIINKEDGKYEVLLTGSDVKVFDLEGNEKTLTFGKPVYKVIKNETICYTDVEGNNTETVVENTVLYTDETLKTKYEFAEGESATNFTYNGKVYPEETELKKYITTEQPLKSLKCVTVGDYTFVVNNMVSTKMLNKKFPDAYPNTALCFVKQGDYGCEYTLKVNDKQGYKKTSTSDVADCRTNVIADAVYTDLKKNLGETDFKYKKVGSTFTVQRKDKGKFIVQATDGNANSNFYAFYKKAEDLSQLPLVAPNGYVMKVIGENINIADDYYVKFETSDGSDFGNGSWQECPSPDIEYQIDKATMPHAIVRNADGTFTFKTIDWTDRPAGDEDSAKTPSFIGNCIQDMFCHKGRLGFVSEDRTCYSDVNDIFLFFKSTTLTELDTDAIDVGSNSRMSLLKFAVPYNKELMLFGENSEFLIQGGSSNFSNGTVSIEMLMEYACSPICKPVPVGSTVLFACDNGDYSKVYEVYTTDTYNVGAREISEQVSQYIPKGLYKIFASSENNIAGFLTDKASDTIFIYNYYYNGTNKAQSAWSKWVFKNTKILDAEFVNNFIYLTLQYSDGVYLEKININSLQGDGDLDFIVYLDRKQKLTVTDKTVNLDYVPVNDIQVVNPDGFPCEFSIENKTITLLNNYDYVYVGNPYESKWKLSSIYKRQTTQSGAMKVVEGILMLKDINLSYADSSYFKVNLIPAYSTAISSTLEFTGIIDGTVSATMNKITPYSSTFLIPVISRNNEIDIEIINDSYLPSCFLSLEWLGEFIIRGK